MRTRLVASPGPARKGCAPATFQLSGSGSGAAFAYEVVQPAPAPLAPEGPITAPDTPVGEKSPVVIRIRNNGNADGRITTIAAEGAAFQFIPFTLTGDVKANNITLADTVQSLSVSATNAQGTSAPLTVEVK